MNVPSLSVITENNRHIARAIMLLATLYFAWRMAGLLWLIAGQDQAALAKPTPVSSAAAPVNVDSSRLASFTIFKAPVVESVSQNANAPDTSLQLKLDGVFASSSQSQSSAIISEQGQGIGKLYRVGQQVVGGAVLSAVYVDRVLLQRNGQEEVLRFIKSNLLGGDTPPVVSNPVASQADKARNLLSNAIQRLDSDASSYLNEMGLIASQQGYEITDNTPSHIRRNLGLKAGDRVVRLNGQTLGNVQLDKNLLQQIQQTGRARIEIQRGGQHLTIEQSF
ncbi:MAG TPA: type II secretion system protein N [Agitococcus sp.]|uniref:type II secretion system protein N n=1 Tax=uncultured Agitococcus sp. TaxID=1506599 RepID=UPI0026277A2E|nr:type II secretion system protein N [uncultured Agitococcus sp.]HMV59823.1 type II secretion system protein N [Agitococcus sp.]HMX98510.1 type II secretion system protein N [Agitococcus sp.]HMY27943.1 type II secretion system protein N [Agitococcus sp.]HMY81983.1 type II secretion system protein N [Agitococcus sp.]HNA19824.1 type II secretion system protein N [Agitococcus sp.]